MGIQQIPLAASGASLAEITTAIQNNAAPASVTNTSIATQVANNSIGAETLEQIAEYKSTSAVTEFNFTSIPQTYKKLFLAVFSLDTTPSQNFYCRINADGTSSTYNYVHLRNSTVDTLSYLSQDRIKMTWNSVTGGQAGSFIMEFPNYTSTASKFYTFQANTTGSWFVTGLGNYRTGSTTNAITSLRIFGDSANGMFFNSNPSPSAVLYGVK